MGPSSLGGKNHNKPVYDPSGAPQYRTQLFNYLGQVQPDMNAAGQASAAALKSAAANPGWGQATDLARRTMAGDYLHGSPELDAAMTANTRQAMSSAADNDARLQSGLARNGMSFGTANQQASEANAASAAASASNTNAQTYLQNYLAERQNQNNAVNNLATATSKPLDYLQGVSGAYEQPLTQAGNLLSALSSGGQVYTSGTSGSYSPSMGSSILQGLGGL